LSFLNPALLIGMMAIAVPIILHFLYRKKIIIIDFSSIFFLKKLQKNKINKVSWLEWLILALRILTIICIVLSFSNPISETKYPLSIPAKSTHFIAVDETIINQLTLDDKSLTNYLNESIREFRQQLNSDDDIYVINTATSEIKKSALNTLSAEIADIDMINRKPIEPDFLLRKITDFADDQDIASHSVHFFTPFQHQDTLENVYFHRYYPENPQYKNHIIKSAEIVQKSITAITPISIRVTLELANTDASLVLTTIVNSETKNETVVQTSGSVLIPIGKYPKGTYDVEIILSVNDDYPYDNTRYMTFEINENRNVLILTQSENSPLSHAFTNIPDSNLNITLDRTVNALSYPLTNYQTVFYEGNVPDNNLIDNIESVLKTGSSSFIFIPTASFNTEGWNQSRLRNRVRFTQPIGSLGSNASQIQFNRNHINSAIMPDLSNFNQRNDDEFFVKYLFGVNPSGLERYMGTRQNRLFIKQRNHRFYAFLFPFDEALTNFIYDSRFVPMMYHLLFLGDEKIDVKNSNLRFKGYINEPTLLISGPERYSLNRERSNELESIFTFPGTLKTGIYTFNHLTRNFHFAYNDEILHSFEFATYEKHDSLASDIESSNYHLWRFFMVIAILFYILELIIGRGKII
jgi:hypothetical protein